jgi:hypothetical protein
MQKPKRIVNKELLKYIREELFCIVCGDRFPDPHHVTSKGAGGPDISTNLMPLCGPGHHTEIHKIGIRAFAIKYPSVRHWLELAKRDDILSRIDTPDK